ncbi:sodium:calcium antiporter [Rhodopirellula sp. SM50]|nr:calcium/sodium antiporter [Rhodopirellula sp. SM50]PAY19159.1 sodium:calcium antiporter [Rhodopirellula sp. SM50]
MVTVFTLVMGLVVLTIGAELLVRGASKLALAVGLSPLVVGLTVVAIGTSAPELVVSLQSTLRGQPDVAMGNVLGSNIFNVLLILGVSALIIPLRVSQQLIRFDVPLMVGLSVLVMIFSLDGRIGRVDGALLVAGLIGYEAWAVIKSRKEQAGITAQYEAEYGKKPAGNSAGRLLLSVLVLIAGLVLLVLGARWFVDAAVLLARQFGVSELVIGLTIVAAGTSLPEVATSIVAAIRGERDIAVGNVVGSNLFNIMGVLGISSLVSTQGVAVSNTAIELDLPVMVAVAVACLPIFFTGHLIARWEGGLFLAYYVAYTAYLVTAATVPAVNRTLSIVMIGFVIPLTVITLAVAVVRYRRAPIGADDDAETHDG